MFRGKRVRFISIEEFNTHLAYCKKYKQIVFGPRELGTECYIANLVVDIVNIYLTYRKGDKTTTYSTRLDGEDATTKITGLLAYQTICKYYKVPNMEHFKWMEKESTKKGERLQISWVIASAVPLLYSNIEKGCQEYDNCYGYDMTSAYGWALLQPIPDTTKKPRFNDEVKKGEIGFCMDGSTEYEGGYGNIIFPLMDSPFDRFVNKWFGIKKYGSKEEKAKAKQMLNYAVGYMQRTNPFIRNTIVNRCNDKIKMYMDESTLYCNTDSIVSLKERKDLPLGPNIGEFHLEHQGTFAYAGFNYQWNHEVPTYRGVAKKWFESFMKKNKRPWSILTDEIPTFDDSEYYFDKDKLQIRRKKRNG